MEPLRNTQLYIGAIVLGVLALIVGVMFIANILLGFHPTRAYIAMVCPFSTSALQDPS